MLFSIVETHRKGIKLTREEIRAVVPVFGRLTISDWREGNASRRALRVARVHHAKLSFNPELLLPLFDPVLVRMTESGFLLAGFQLESVAERMAEHVQGWWVDRREL